MGVSSQPRTVSVIDQQGGGDRLAAPALVQQNDPRWPDARHILRSAHRGPAHAAAATRPVRPATGCRPVSGLGHARIVVAPPLIPRQPRDRVKTSRL
jgi:hypothetical protein